MIKNVISSLPNIHIYIKDLELEPIAKDGTEIDFINEYQQVEFLVSLEQALNKALPSPEDLHNKDEAIRYLSGLMIIGALFNPGTCLLKVKPCVCNLRGQRD